MAEENKYGSFLKKAFEPENYTNIVLPLAAVAESIWTKGASPGTAAMGQQKFLTGLMDTKRKQKMEDADFAEKEEQRKESARMRALKRQMGQEVQGLDFDDKDAYKKVIGSAIRNEQLAPKDIVDLVRDRGVSGLSGWKLKSDELEAIKTMAEGPEKDKAMKDWEKKWATSSYLAMSPEYADAMAAKAAKVAEAGIAPAVKKAVLTEDATRPGKVKTAEEEVKAREEGKRDVGITLSETSAERLGDFNASFSQLHTLANQYSNPDAPQGPISQLRKTNPYDWQAQAKQQLVATTKQMVGKALEGGVLRKEDEEKYNKILPTIADTYESAVQKTKNLETMLDNAYRAKRGALKSAGYFVDNFAESLLGGNVGGGVNSREIAPGIRVRRVQ